MYQLSTNEEQKVVAVAPDLQPTSALMAQLTPTVEPTSENEIIEPNRTPQVELANSTPLSLTYHVQKPYIGIWLSEEELRQLPTNGPAWNHLKQAADEEIEEPDISDMNDVTDVYILAKALVYARTGQAQYLQETITALNEAIGTEAEGETLALGRNLVPYIISADLINLPTTQPELHKEFSEWLNVLLTTEMGDGRTLRETHELRPNNWGTHAGASRAAIALYLGDEAELQQTAQIFKAWLGDRSAYAGFEYGRKGWQADPDNPVGINPAGSIIDGHNVDGALPEEMRRGGRFHWPPRETGYAWEGLQGAIVQAEILSRAGYPAWQWQDQALLRAVNFLYEIGWPAEGDDEWQIWLINKVYGTNFPTKSAPQPGKNMGWTDWTHG